MGGQRVAMQAGQTAQHTAASHEQRRSVASQTDFQEPDEATLRNELAMTAYLEILSVLDDERQPVYHDLGEAFANKVLLLAAADDEDRQTEVADEAGATAAAPEEAESPQTPQNQRPKLQRLASLESQVIESEWSLRCKLAQVRESAKHPVQRWLEGATGSQAASPFASLAASVRSGGQQQPHHRHPSTSCGSRPSSVAGLSEVFVSDSEEDEDDAEPGREPEAQQADAGDRKSEMTFYNCAVHGVEVPESFVRVKFKGGGIGGGGSGSDAASGK